MNAVVARSIGIGIVAAGVAAGTGGPAAQARDFVQDGAGMFSSTTVAQLNARIGNFNTQTGKEIIVVTAPSLGTSALQSAAADAFAAQKVNGVLIFIARDDRRDIIVPDRAGSQAGWFAPEVLRSVRTAMEAQFRSGAYDDGITGAVNSILGIYRSHLGSLRQTNPSAVVPGGRTSSSMGGWHISMFWWIIIAVVGFLIVRSVLRTLATPRPYGGGPVPPGGVPAAGAGYGPGYGGYGGGGSFWSGLLGGLGGAWLGNELFRGGGGIAPTQAGQIGPDGGGSWGSGDSGGWQSDAGQADTTSASGGDWGGGGFGGDFGGGDMGGGGGDAGGGW